MSMQDKAQLSHELVSDVMDGRVHGPAFMSAMRTLSSDEGRECWHVYHLIGDVLRSDDLAACDRDLAFIQRLDAQLAKEPRAPHVVTPAVPVQQAGVLTDVARPAANDSVFRWKVAAGLASFAAVAAMGWGMLGGAGSSTDAAGQLAQSQAVPMGTAAMTLAAVPAASGAGMEQVPVMLRDPRLDEFLAAHRQASGVSALGDASGFLRNATFEGPGR